MPVNCIAYDLDIHAIQAVRAQKLVETGAIGCALDELDGWYLQAVECVGACRSRLLTPEKTD